MLGLALDLFHRTLAVGATAIASSPIIANH
jgi:hypothetical protein